MAGAGKQKTTMAKRNREAKAHERRAAKAARKEERRRLLELPEDHPDRVAAGIDVTAADVNRELLGVEVGH